MNEIGRNLFEETGDSEGDRSEVIESETHFIATDRRPTAALVKCVAASFQRAASRPRSRSGIDSRLPPELFETAGTIFPIFIPPQTRRIINNVINYAILCYTSYKDK